jgi:hypothetical protein
MARVSGMSLGGLVPVEEGERDNVISDMLHAILAHGRTSIIRSSKYLERAPPAALVTHQIASSPNPPFSASVPTLSYNVQ